MIKLVRYGQYELSETKHQTKVLALDDDFFAWVNVEGIGEILVTARDVHDIECVLCRGTYKMYEVKDEPNLTDLVHLELFVGDGMWQGYLLTTGLPNEEKIRVRVIPTKEIITKSTH
ncbi:MAG: hypothetical protein KBC15_02655 [Candidatus Levybacteria bacterium]|nr:hypothetical protein [Candidatus Levybacteria bacterium]